MIHKSSFRRILLTLFIAVLPFVSLFFDVSTVSYGEKVSALSFLNTLPYILFGVLIVVGFRLKQMEVVGVSSLYLFVLTYLHGYLPIWIETHIFHKVQTLAVAIPLTLVGVFSVSYLQFTDKKKAYWIALIAPSTVLFAGLLVGVPGFSFGSIESVDPQSALFPLPLAAVLAVAIFALQGIRLERQAERGVHTEVTLSLIPIFFALGRGAIFFENPQAFQADVSIAFVAGGALIGFGIYHFSWYRWYEDKLTGLLNKRAWAMQLPQSKRFLSIAVAEVDYLSVIATTYGWSTAEHVLKFVSRELKDKFGSQVVYRTGLTTFSFIFEGKEDFEVAKALEDIREILSQKEFFVRMAEKIREKATKKARGKEVALGPKIPLTLSIGIASQHRQKRRVFPKVVAEAAEMALGQAQLLGRDRVVLRPLEPAWNVQSG